MSNTGGAELVIKLSADELKELRKSVSSDSVELLTLIARALVLKTNRVIFTKPTSDEIELINSLREYGSSEGTDCEPAWASALSVTLVELQSPHIKQVVSTWAKDHVLTIDFLYGLRRGEPQEARLWYMLQAVSSALIEKLRADIRAAL